MKLDVGCGSYKGHKFSVEENVIRIDIIKNEVNKKYLHVLCDAHHLPFRQKTFSLVLMSHVLEHLMDPLGALKEAIRVSNAKVIVIVPHPLSREAKQRGVPERAYTEHRWFFNKWWFQKSLRNYNLRIRITFKPRFQLFGLPLLNMPSEIVVEVTK